MKARYILQKDMDLESKWQEISTHFDVEVKTLEDGTTKILYVASGIRIIQTITEANFVFKIGGASSEDITTLTSILGEPKRVGQEKLSLNDFAGEVMKIPDIETKTKDQIIDYLDMDEAEFQEHFTKLERFGKRGRGPAPLLKAYKVIKKE